MTSLEIHVTGTGVSIRRAERGILVLQAQSQQVASAEEASAIVTSATNKLREAIAPYCLQDEWTGQPKDDAAIAHYSMSTLDTNSHRERRSDTNENVIYDTTYSARVELKIKFSDFSVLDKLATQFSAMETVRIVRITWNLTDATLDSIKGGARKRAAQDAIQRARDFAEVFANLSTDEVKEKVKAVEVKEGSNYQSSTRPQLHLGKRQRMRGENLVDKTEFQFEPEDVRLEVSVFGRFHVEV